ncbi:ABC transporter ATP-binding protein [Candidatus Peregrinibacteria bacterium]|nr:ABC transporter ATP-binding protein [Candidatus Peregrinibacteria bacterium]
MALIELKNAEKIYSDGEVKTPALRGVSFKIEHGEFVAIMGPSGSGKSTLLHLLGFLDLPTSGEYFFDGKSFSEYSADEIAALRNQKIGFIFQMFNLLPRTSVLENVKLPMLYSDISESEWFNRALNAIEEVGLSHRINHETSQLSGGERQRVAIARALINNPSVIFADEPTGNLDSKSGGQIMNLISALNKKGHTIILVTHETYTARYAQRIITLKDGAVENDKKAEERKGVEEFFK